MSLIRWPVVLVLLLASGCATVPDPAPPLPPPVYPPPPEQGRFIFERSLLYNDDVEEYTTKQRFTEFATGASHKLRGLVKPFDVAVHNDRVYVTDTVQRNVILFDIAGKRYLEIGGDDPGQLQKPLGIAIADNELFVTDISARRIMVYNLDGQFIRAIGSKDVFDRPTDVALSPDGNRLYVVDTGGIESQHHQVQVFDRHSGQLLNTIGRRGTQAGEFNLPLQIAVNSSGQIHVVDGGNFRIQVFDPAGTFLHSFGSVGRYPGQFARPKGIAIGPDDHIFVVDAAFGNSQIFNSQGQLLMFIGERGHAGQPGKFMLPSGIAVDQQGKVYIVDQFFRKIDIFRPLEPASN